MSQILKNYILNTNKITNISNLLKTNNKLNSNINSFKNLLEFNLKELNIYNKNINLYISKLNNKMLILNIKKNPISKIDYILSSDNNLLLNKSTTNESEDKNINILKIKENILLNNNNNNNKTSNFSNYIKFININNSINKDKLFTYNQQINYNYNNTNNKLIKKIYLFLFYSFFSMNSLISKPIIEITPNKVVIHLFFYLFKENNIKNINKNNTFIKFNQIKLNIISKILSKMFNKSVELDLVRLSYPYFDSNIFVNLLNILINKIQIRIIMQTFFKKAIIKNPINLITNKNYISNKIPSFLSGINLKIGGRLMTHRVVPKQTIKIIRKGALTRGKIKFFDTARYTNKNRRGAFSLTLSIGHYLR
jgi:Mitochondrial ribosomal protein (VAR1)